MRVVVISLGPGTVIWIVSLVDITSIVGSQSSDMNYECGGHQFVS